MCVFFFFLFSFFFPPPFFVIVNKHLAKQPSSSIYPPSQDVLPCFDKSIGLGDLVSRLDAIEVGGDPLDLKRYAEVFWELFVAGQQVAPGGEIGAPGEPANELAVFAAEKDEDLDALVEAALTLLQRKTFMRPVLEEEFCKLSLFIGAFSEEHVARLAKFIGLFHARSVTQQPLSFMLRLKNSQRLVDQGLAQSFVFTVLRIFRDNSSTEKVVSCIKLTKADEILPELLPNKKREPAEMLRQLAAAGLEDLSKFIQETSLKHVTAELTEMMGRECPASEVNSHLKSNVTTFSVSNANAMSVFYQALMESIQWSKRSEQHVTQLVGHLKTYGKIFAPYVGDSIKLQVELINKLQTDCVEHMGLNKAFMQVIQLLYNADVLEEDAIQKWHKGTGIPIVAKERTDMVAQLTPFITWLDNAEEEDD